MGTKTVTAKTNGRSNGGRQPHYGLNKARGNLKENTQASSSTQKMKVEAAKHSSRLIRLFCYTLETQETETSIPVPTRWYLNF